MKAVQKTPPGATAAPCEDSPFITDAAGSTPTPEAHLARRDGEQRALIRELKKKNLELRRRTEELGHAHAALADSNQKLRVELATRVKAEASLRESEDRFKSVFAESPLAKSITRPTGEVSVNRAFCELLGYAPAEMESRHWREISHPDDIAETERQIATMLAGESERVSFTKRYLHKNGAIVWAEVSTTLRRARGGQPLYFITTVNDITERRRMNDALRESEERFRVAIENANDVVYEWDLQKNVRWVGKLDEMLGYPPGEFPRTFDGWLEAVHPDDRPSIDAAVRAHLEHKAPYSVEYRVREKSGRYRWWSARGAATRLGDGKPLRWIGTVTDITERKEADEAQVFLAQTSSGPGSEPFFNTLARYLATSLHMDFICIDRLEGDGLSARTLAVWRDGEFRDNATYALKDTPYGEVKGRTVCCFPADVSRLFPRDPLLQELRAESYVGVTLWSHRGQPIGLIALVSRQPLANRARAEATLKLVALRAAWEMERLEVELALRTREAEFRALAESMPQIVWTARADGGNTYFNQQWVDYTGLTLEESHGHGWNTPFHPDDRQRAWDAWRNAKKNCGRYSLECRLRRADGAYRWWLVRGVPMRDANGEILKWFGTCTDIEEIKQSEQEVRRLNSELEERVHDRTAELLAANEELEAFSYSVSHDLRAPLRSIDGFSRILLEDFGPKLDGDGRDSLARICAATQRMAALIDDLLELSRVSRATFCRRQVDLSAAAHEVAKALHRTEPNRLVEWVIADGVMAHGDPHLLRIVLENLIGNAWKFTGRRAPARIEFGAVPEGGQNHYFVRDNGAGYDETFAGKLFGAFQRLHTTTEFPGTGIGLATVQRIIRRHGGRAWGEGAVDQGATFFFSVPSSSTVPPFNAYFS